MTRFRYTGPQTGLKTAKGEIHLFPGKVYDLDPQDPALKIHRHLRRLEPVADSPAPVKTKKKAVSEPPAAPEPIPAPAEGDPEPQPTSEGGQP